MIFNSLTKQTDQYLESYKERNFYYKVFAGYLFNEIIPGVEHRKRQFHDLLLDTCEREGPNPLAHGLLTSSRHTFLQESQVTFDFHPIQWDRKYKDYGEMSDMVVWMPKFFYSVEFKFLSNLSFDKDIAQVQKRISWVADKTKDFIGDHKEPIQILLISETKWNGSDKFMNKPIPKLPFVVIFWEDILNIVDDDRVKEFIKNQLSRI